MSDVTTLGNRISNLEAAPQFQPYSKVIIHVSDEVDIIEGNDSGRTLEVDNPFGTQAMAQAMLASLSGKQYQPYYADGALLDPAAEIGDGANMRNTYGGIYTRSRTFGRLMKADISAPHDEEINHEYAFESPTERKFTRQVDDLRASLIIANDRIDASVSQTGGNNSSFGWSLTSNAHRWYANGQEVMAVTASGLSVTGVITATSGTIGGFSIGSSSLHNGMSSFSDTSNGVYVGTDGISIGGGAFRVTSAGYLTLRGTINFENADGTSAGSISAANLQIGASQAYANYGGWSGTTATVNANKTYWSNGAATAYSAQTAAANAQARADQADAKADNALGYFSGTTTASNMIITRARISQMYLAAAWRTLGRATVTINGSTYSFITC